VDVLGGGVQSGLTHTALRHVAGVAHAARRPTPYLVLLAGLTADGIVKQLANFSSLSYVPMVAAIAVFLLWSHVRGGPAQPARAVTVILLALACWTVVELFNPAGPLRPGALTTAVLRYLPIACLWLAPRLLAQPHQRRAMFHWMTLLALATAAFGLIEYLMGPERVAELGPGFDPERASRPWYSPTTHSYVVRPSSLFSAPALAVEFCLAGLLASGWLMLDASRSRRVLALVSICGSVGFIAVSGNRAVIVQLAVMLLVMAVLLAPSRRLIVPVVIGAMAMALTYLAVPAVAERMGPLGDLGPTYQAEYYVTPSQFVARIADAPFGAGFGVTGDLIGQNIENQYLMIAEDTGVPGLLMFLSLLAVVTLLAIRRARGAADPADRFLAVGIAGYTVSMLVAMNTGLGLDKVTVAYVFWTLAGLAVAEPAVLAAAERRADRRVRSVA
jgi:hypothetical protein